jgi:hypothetical protein
LHTLDSQQDVQTQAAWEPKSQRQLAAIKEKLRKSMNCVDFSARAGCSHKNPE